MDTLNKIISDLLEDKDINYVLATTPYEELGSLHFSVGKYIRNKYLWHNTSNFKALSAIFNTCDIDSISRCIIEDLYFLIHKK